MPHRFQWSESYRPAHRLQLKEPVYYIGVFRLFPPRYQYHSRACVRQNANEVRLAEKPHSLRPPAHGANRSDGPPTSDVQIPTLRH